MKKRTILITGVCGSIGSHLLDELLARGERVVGVDDFSFGKIQNIAHQKVNKNFIFHELDICDHERLKKKVGKVDLILHQAAVKKTSEKEASLPTLRVNSIGAESVLKLARWGRSKVILASTSDVYGNSTKIPFNEHDECSIGTSTAKRWAYAVSKLFAEHLAMAYYKDFGVSVVILRYFGSFSERSSTSWSGGHIPVFIDAILKGKPVIIHGDGTQTRSMGHVSDIVRGTLLAIDHPKAIGEIINIGNDEEVSVLDSAKRIHQISNSKKPLQLKFIPMRKVFGNYREIQRRVPDLSKARKLLGYVPQVSFEEGLRRVIACRKGSS